MKGGSSHIYHTFSDTVVLLFVIDTTMSVIQYLYLCVTPGFLMQKQHLWIPVFTSSFTRFPYYYAVMLSAQCSVSSSQLLTSNSVLASGCSSCCGCCVDTVVVAAVWTQMWLLCGHSIMATVWTECLLTLILTLLLQGMTDFL